LMNAQGEDVVAGVRTPFPIDHLEEQMPEVYQEFLEISKRLERHYSDMQDLEFTIENGKLFILQTRSGKRTATAALQIAVDLVAEGLTSREEALLNIDPKQLDALLHPGFDPDALKAASRIAKGLPASPGAATGQIAFTAEQAAVATADGRKVILAREETSPEDIQGMAASEGILTSRGGMTSHAAVVARGMGKCCVSGAGSLMINYKTRTITVDGKTYKEGDWISLNGSTGQVLEGKVETQDPELSGDFAKIMELADKHTKMKVRTNADTPKDATVARNFGAEGIGLCRTEHMFFEGDRIKAMREMILADDEAGRRKALDKLLPMQRGDFEGIFTAMNGFPVTVRLLDPPLHEFVPHEEKDQIEIAKDLGIDPQTVKNKVASLHEFNPMLGHRGCRLGNTYPEITEMQARAIIEAAINVQKQGVKVLPEIMVPLIGTLAEFKMQEEIIRATADKVFKESGTKVEYMVGTMIEIPRAALTADKIAEHAEFFSFGTNDLTQMTFGYSRDDAGVFLPVYLKKNLLKHDPFQILDQEGVGQLVEMGTKRGRSARPNLKVGICGEHGGEPSSVEFCHRVGMNYVSCSPYRVPIARLAAAMAAIR
ncbi:MAG TPA: pyruvate, phosphate dikinase, partial [Candidatus Cloacimonas sp.]|nr:pyruvate, phosphate dikinase [Candidatus Cloacimonas sp.]